MPPAGCPSRSLHQTLSLDGQRHHPVAANSVWDKMVDIKTARAGRCDATVWREPVSGHHAAFAVGVRTVAYPIG